MTELLPLDGGWGLFRGFKARRDGNDHVVLTALTSSYAWGPGPRAAECRCAHYAEPLDRPDEWVDRPDRIPVLGCGCGFYGFKSYGELLAQEGYANDLVYALMRMWGLAIEHETGMRAEFAEIVAFTEPGRPEHLKSFPREGLALSFPNVRIVELKEVKEVIADLGLTLLQKSPAPRGLQWLTPEGELVWLQEPHKPREEEAKRLPIAAKYRSEAITVEIEGPSPVAYCLRKSRYQDDNDKVYLFWECVGSSRTDEVFQEFYELIQRGGTAMDVHLE